MGGVDPSQGNVQVCGYGVWGYVCQHGWGTASAQVVCRQLGYSTTGQYHMAIVVYSSFASFLGALQCSRSFFGYGNGTLWLNYVHCSGTETNLLDCHLQFDFGVKFVTIMNGVLFVMTIGVLLMLELSVQSLDLISMVSCFIFSVCKMLLLRRCPSTG